MFSGLQEWNILWSQGTKHPLVSAVVTKRSVVSSNGTFCGLQGKTLSWFSLLQFQHSSAYSATKAHKINHNFRPNCEWTHADHPCYGRVPAVRTIQVYTYIYIEDPRGPSLLWQDPSCQNYPGIPTHWQESICKATLSIYYLKYCSPKLY